MTGVRTMYWPNEPAHLYPDFVQAGGRAAFQAMEADGTIGALNIYSQRVERAKYPHREAFEEAARREIAAFDPDILFVQHLQDTDMQESFWRRLRDERPKTTLIFHEADPYDRFAKRIDQATIDILRHADLVLACGLGSLAAILADHAKCRIAFMPHCFVESRFAQHDPAQAVKTDLITMIGNRGRRPRLKMLYIPGGRKRAELASELSAAFGSGFALYGNGWSHLPSSRGLLPFFQQEAAIQSARITANWDHFDGIDYYFSDRLPISLAAGVPHVTSWHVGYDHLLANVPGLYACKTVSEAVETCRWLVSRPDSELLADGLAGKAWVFANMEANMVFKRGMEQAIMVHRERIGV